MMATSRNMRRQRQAAQRAVSLRAVRMLGCQCAVELEHHGERFLARHDADCPFVDAPRMYVLADLNEWGCRL